MLMYYIYVGKNMDSLIVQDIDGFGIAPKIIQTTSDYCSEKKERSKKRVLNYYDGPIPGEPVLHNILQPVRYSYWLYTK